MPDPYLTNTGPGYENHVRISTFSRTGAVRLVQMFMRSNWHCEFSVRRVANYPGSCNFNDWHKQMDGQSLGRIVFMVCASSSTTVVPVWSAVGNRSIGRDLGLKVQIPYCVWQIRHYGDISSVYDLPRKWIPSTAGAWLYEITAMDPSVKLWVYSAPIPA